MASDRGAKDGVADRGVVTQRKVSACFFSFVVGRFEERYAQAVFFSRFFRRFVVSQAGDAVRRLVAVIVQFVGAGRRFTRLPTRPVQDVLRGHVGVRFGVERGFEGVRVVVVPAAIRFVGFLRRNARIVYLGGGHYHE